LIDVNEVLSWSLSSLLGDHETDRPAILTFITAIDIDRLRWLIGFAPTAAAYLF